jgi:hypothetical protein
MNTPTKLMGAVFFSCAACCFLPWVSLAFAGAGPGLLLAQRELTIAVIVIGGAIGAAVWLRRRSRRDSSSACGCNISTESAVPIACTLSGDDFRARVHWIRNLAQRSLRKADRQPLSLSLTYDCAAAADVRELVRRERTCCAFLDFYLVENADGMHLTVTAPPSARDVAEMLFDHFAPDLARAIPVQQKESA